MITYAVYAVHSKNRKDFIRSFPDKDAADFFVKIMKKLDARDGFPANEYRVESLYLFTKKELETIYPEHKEI
jgi:hypothetical protein